MGALCAAVVCALATVHFLRLEDDDAPSKDPGTFSGMTLIFSVLGAAMVVIGLP